MFTTSRCACSSRPDSDEPSAASRMRQLGRPASKAHASWNRGRCYVDGFSVDSPLATSLQEASILAIARAGARNGHPARMYTTLHTARLEAAAPKLPHPGLRRVVEGQLARRSFAGIASDNVEPLAGVPRWSTSSRCAFRVRMSWHPGSCPTR
jgi:hypothetical protein